MSHHQGADYTSQPYPVKLFRFADSLVAQTVKRLPAMQEPRLDPRVRKIPWRRKWQPTPVLLLRKFHGWRNLVGYSPWGRKELDMTERLHFHFHLGSLGDSLVPQLVRNLPAKQETQTQFLAQEDPLEKG